MFSMEYLFFLLCARYCQTCARCGLAVRYFPFHCLQVSEVDELEWSSFKEVLGWIKGSA